MTVSVACVSVCVCVRVCVCVCMCSVCIYMLTLCRVRCCKCACKFKTYNCVAYAVLSYYSWTQGGMDILTLLPSSLAHFNLNTLTFVLNWNYFIILPFNAITRDAGFMIAESAEIGLLIGFWGVAMSTMTTWAASPTFSRTHMNLSDSMVSVANSNGCALIPIFWSWTCDKGKTVNSVMLPLFDYIQTIQYYNTTYTYVLSIMVCYFYW